MLTLSSVTSPSSPLQVPNFKMSFSNPKGEASCLSALVNVLSMHLEGSPAHVLWIQDLIHSWIIHYMKDEASERSLQFLMAKTAYAGLQGIQRCHESTVPLAGAVCHWEPRLRPCRGKERRPGPPEPGGPAPCTSGSLFYAGPTTQTKETRRWIVIILSH